MPAPIHALILDSEVSRHPHTTFASVVEAFGPDREQKRVYACAVERYRKPSKAPQIVRGVLLALLCALALVGLLAACKVIA